MDDPLAQPLPDSPDIMNDPAFAPTQRNDTASSKYSSEFGGETCRICRSEGTTDEPLFHPCKCSGSIKFVHQECLMEWLSHSHKKHCELCKTPFRFTKLYDANMPRTLPWAVFAKRACIHAVTLCVKTLRALLVGLVWLVFIPYTIRWSWRWMFWVAEAGWERESFLRDMQARHVASQAQAEFNETGVVSKISQTHHMTWDQIWKAQAGTPLDQPTNDLKQIVSQAISSAPSNGTANTTVPWSPQNDTSILSSWTYLSQTTSNEHVNRWILDVFEGQLITCVVITGFILIFLIREWVVQQQPLVNLDAVNFEQQERERLVRETERLRMQTQLLEEGRARLHMLEEQAQELANEMNTSGTIHREHAIDGPEFIGWEKLAVEMDRANAHLRREDEAGRAEFEKAALDVVREVRSAERSEVSAADLSEKMFWKLALFTAEERYEWEEILVSELKRMDEQAQTESFLDNHESLGQRAEAKKTDFAESSSSGRPPMPARDTSFRATQVQRILADANGPAVDLLLNDSSDALADTAGALGEEGSQVATLQESDPSSPLTDDSWQHVGRPEAQEPDDHADIFPESNDEMPITNAGPDAKVNIKRKGTARAKTIVPEPKDETAVVSAVVTDAELSRRLGEPSSSTPASGALMATPVHSATQASEQDNETANPIHSESEGSVPEQSDSETLRDRVASVFREEFGLEEEHIQDLHQTGQGQIGQSAGPTVQPATATIPVTDRPTTMQRVYDWFWGDIHPQEAQEPALPPVEERIGEGGDAQEAPFVPIEDGVHPANGETQHPGNEGENNDDVPQAAQQAGLDADAVEDAEDLEGIFELIGFQGPIIGLFQTSCFCTVLVAGTVFGAVGLPYIWGKLVLSIIASPLLFLVKSPLRLASLFADTIIDLTLVSLGVMTYGAAWFVDLMWTPIELLRPRIANHDYTPWILNRAKSTAVNAANRIFDLFLVSEPIADVDVGWSRAYLSASVHAHASLANLKDHVNAVLNYTGCTATTVVHVVAVGSPSVAWKSFLGAWAHVAELPANVMTALHSAVQYVRPVFSALGSLKTGALTFEAAGTSVNPSLVYWSTTDRGLAILTGYIALALIAAIYVALDTPITSTPSGQHTEKLIRDSLRQAGGVLKVIFIISIEMLAFPLYCGLLLDFAFLPLFQADNVATRWAFAVRAPATFCFVHWFIGTCYMFHFALFVSMCRKILRKGLLWFIRDPDDPTFHPVRDVLERNVTTQLRKIAFSALVYGALVILCLGGVIWSIGKMFKGIFPIQWISTEPALELPFDLMLFNFLTPLLFKLFKPSNAVHSMYSWWLRKCARGLRLSHFLFDDRRKDEEGRHVRRSWTTLLALKQGVPGELQIPPGDESPDVYFERDGKYVLTPCSDQYRPPKPGEAFLHADEEDVYITDKEGKKHEHFAKIYVPPLFRLRLTLFMVCLWIFSAFTGLCATLVPLVFGRQIFKALLPANVLVNDIYAYSLGAYIICGALFAVYKREAGARYLRDKAQSLDVHALATATTRYSIQALKCAYVYGFLGVVLPLVFALVMQLYVVIPLHTYLLSTARSAPPAASNLTAGLTNTTVIHTNGANAAMLENGTVTLPATHPSTKSLPLNVVEHKIHLLADYALGILYVRIAMRFILTAPTSRAAEAFRRITADGYLNPNPQLATRYFILPVSLLAFTLLAGPLGIAAFLMQVAGRLGWQGGVKGAFRTVIYRYSYPLIAGLGALIWAFGVVGSAVNKCRASVRDEVYLVGERLHNFGEGRPPVGSRSVVRRER